MEACRRICVCTALSGCDSYLWQPTLRPGGGLAEQVIQQRRRRPAVDRGAARRAGRVLPRRDAVPRRAAAVLPQLTGCKRLRLRQRLRLHSCEGSEGRHLQQTAEGSRLYWLCCHRPAMHTMPTLRQAEGWQNAEELGSLVD